MLRCKIYIISFLFLTVSGCVYRHVDRITPFIINGRVYDKTTATLVSQRIVVYLIDTGFDDKRYRYQKRELKIGESDDCGIINLEFNYWWGVTEGMFKRKLKKTFSIELRGEKYQNIRFDFKGDDLMKEGGEIIVPLGDIFLESIK